MEENKLQRSYEDVPYPDMCYPQTHPDRLATLATLFGLKPAPVTNCRVLELGCANGGNIIPMAYGLPGSEFVGIDFSSRQIETGQSIVDNLGIRNIKLVQADILNLQHDIGKFDYIIAHGFYSWIPDDVREGFMTMCKHNLSSDGIIYINFNTYPGWHMKDAFRNMMIYHTRKVAHLPDRVKNSRQLISFMSESINVNDRYGTFLNAYDHLAKLYNQFIIHKRKTEDVGDTLLLHDELEEINDAFYFHEFIDHAARHNLQYIVEADLPSSVTGNFPSKIEKALLDMSNDIIELEQYMDFVRNRTFRQSLLCRDNMNIDRSLKPEPSWVAVFYVASHISPINKDVNMLDNSVVEFHSADGAVATTSHPVLKAAMLHLTRISPKAILLTTLLEDAVQFVYNNKLKNLDAAIIDRETHVLLEFIMQLHSQSLGLIELKVHEPGFVVEPKERPSASKLARFQLTLGYNEVTNLRHERISLQRISSHLLPLLDGRNNRKELLDILISQVKDGSIQLTQNGRQVDNESAMRNYMGNELEINLKWLGRMALLEA